MSSLENIQLLKWCKEYGIRPYWNILWGVPGEDPAEYRRMAKLIPLLTHLPSPRAAGPIRMDRFSPNFTCADRRGFSDLQPYPAYRHIYPFPPAVVANLARYFTHTYKNPQPVSEYVQALESQVRHWQQVHQTSDLFSVDRDAYLFIWDLRAAVDACQLTVLTGLQKSLYLSCDSISTRARLLSATASDHKQPMAEHLDMLLEPIIKRGLMIRDGDSYLSLAIPLAHYSPSSAAIAKLRDTVGRIQRRCDGGVLRVADFELVQPKATVTGSSDVPVARRRTIMTRM